MKVHLDSRQDYCNVYPLHKISCTVLDILYFEITPFYLYRWLSPVPNKPCFFHVCSASLLKTLWEKEKLLVNEQFLLSPVFSTCLVTCNFLQIKNCHQQTFSVCKSLKIIVQERIKTKDTVCPLA